MFQNLQKICLQSTSEPLLVARSANGIGATIVCESKSGADWMKSKGCKTITVSDLESEDFDPASIDPKTPIIFTTKALKAMADHGQYLQASLHELSVQLAREEDRHKATKEDLTKRFEINEAQRSEASRDLAQAKARIEDLLEGNTKLLHELAKAHARPWWKRWFGKTVIIVSCLVLAMFATGCDGGGVAKGERTILEYEYDGCTYLRLAYLEVPIIHSATCSNPKHGGVLKCN